MPELPPPNLFEEIYRRHGHRCPMSTLGGRMGYAALRRLPAAGQGAELRAVCYARTCAVDGIAHATGCSEADGTLVIDDRRRHALILTDRRSGRRVEIVLSEAALAMAGEYRDFRAGIEKRRPQLGPVELDQLEAQREKMLDHLLDRLRRAAEGTLLICRELAEAPTAERRDA